MNWDAPKQVRVLEEFEAAELSAAAIFAVFESRAPRTRRWWLKALGTGGAAAALPWPAAAQLGRRSASPVPPVTGAIVNQVIARLTQLEGIRGLTQAQLDALLQPSSWPPSAAQPAVFLVADAINEIGARASQLGLTAAAFQLPDRVHLMRLYLGARGNLLGLPPSAGAAERVRYVADFYFGLAVNEQNLIARLLESGRLPHAPSGSFFAGELTTAADLLRPFNDALAGNIRELFNALPATYRRQTGPRFVEVLNRVLEPIQIAFWPYGYNVNLAAYGAPRTVSVAGQGYQLENEVSVPSPKASLGIAEGRPLWGYAPPGTGFGHFQGYSLLQISKAMVDKPSRPSVGPAVTAVLRAQTQTEVDKVAFFTVHHPIVKKIVDRSYSGKTAAQVNALDLIERKLHELIHLWFGANARVDTASDLYKDLRRTMDDRSAFTGCHEYAAYLGSAALSDRPFYHLYIWTTLLTPDGNSDVYWSPIMDRLFRDLIAEIKKTPAGQDLIFALPADPAERLSIGQALSIVESLLALEDDQVRLAMHNLYERKFGALPSGQVLAPLRRIAAAGDQGKPFLARGSAAADWDISRLVKSASELDPKARSQLFDQVFWEAEGILLLSLDQAVARHFTGLNDATAEPGHLQHDFEMLWPLLERFPAGSGRLRENPSLANALRRDAARTLARRAQDNIRSFPRQLAVNWVKWKGYEARIETFIYDLMGLSELPASPDQPTNGTPSNRFTPGALVVHVSNFDLGPGLITSIHKNGARTEGNGGTVDVLFSDGQCLRFGIPVVTVVFDAIPVLMIVLEAKELAQAHALIKRLAKSSRTAALTPDLPAAKGLSGHRAEGLIASGDNDAHPHSHLEPRRDPSRYLEQKRGIYAGSAGPDDPNAPSGGAAHFTSVPAYSISGLWSAGRSSQARYALARRLLIRAISLLMFLTVLAGHGLKQSLRAAPARVLEHAAMSAIEKPKGKHARATRLAGEAA